jgi:hypothetical protein
MFLCSGYTLDALGKYHRGCMCKRYYAMIIGMITLKDLSCVLYILFALNANNFAADWPIRATVGTKGNCC